MIPNDDVGAAGWRARLLDTRLCPACGSPLSGPVCTGCGIDLSGPRGHRLLALSRQAADALAERDGLLTDLGAEARRRRPVAPVPTPPAPVPPAPVPPAPVPPAPVPPAPVPPPAPPAWSGPPAAPAWSGPPVPQPLPPTVLPPQAVPQRPPLAARIGVQGLLVALGALLVAVAGIVFLVFAWDRLSLGGRAAVIGAITVAAMAGAAWLRPRLAETAEAIGAIAVVLVLGDAWAVRAVGLFGTDRWDGAGYAAAAAGVCAVVTAAWGVVGRVRAGTVTASVLAPLTPVLVGGWLAPHAGTPANARAVVLGLLGASVVGSGRVAVPLWRRVELAMLRWAAVLAMVVALALTPLLEPWDGHWSGAAALVLATAAVASALQAWADRRAAARRSGLWSLLVGAIVALAAVVAGRAGVEAAGVRTVWMVAVAPAAAALTVVGWSVLVRSGRGVPGLRGAAALAAGRIVAVAGVAPALVLLVTMVALVGSAAVPPWHWSPGRTLDDVARFGAGATTAWGAMVVGFAVTALLLAMSRPGRWWRAVAALAAAAALGAPLVPTLPVALVCLLLALVAVVAVMAVVAVGTWAASRRSTIRPTALVVAGLAGTLSVVLAWSTRDLSVPVTVAGIVALVPARRVVPQPARPALAAVAALATAAVAGAVAGLLGVPVTDRIVVAGIAGALAGAIAVGVPSPARGRFAGRGPVPVERLVAAGAGVAVALGAGLHAAGADGSPGVRAARLATVAGALLVAAVAGALPRVRAAATAGAEAPPVFAAAVAPLASATAACVAVALAAPGSGREAGNLAAAAALGVAAVLLAVIGLRTPADARRLPAELGTAGAAVVVLAVGCVFGLGTSWLWVLWLLLGAAVTADAAPADRRRLGWPGWVLLTGSSWLRLRQADIGVVEAYTVPPALALLAVGALRLRRDPGAGAARALLPGLGLALAPSVLACAGGPPWRPVALLVLAGVAVAGAALWARWTGLLLLAGSGVAAGVGVIRPVVRAAAWSADRLNTDVSLPGLVRVDPAATALSAAHVEAWSLAAAAVLAVAAAQAVRIRHRAVPALRGAALVPALLVAAGPTLYAASAAANWGDNRVVVVRAAVALATAALLTGVAAWLPVRHVLTQPLAGTALGVAAVAAALGLGTRIGVVEAWTAPLAAAVLALGAAQVRRRPGLRSWPALGPGLALLLLPTLVLAAPGHAVWRIVTLTVVAAGVVVVGARLRLQAPVLLGGAVLAAHAALQLGPWVIRTVAGLPRWTVLAAVGVVLLGLGATYERRLREMRAVRMRLAGLR